ncbi:MAG: hypothetical protein ABI553_06490 [Chloroflexota bacterium]
MPPVAVRILHPAPAPDAGPIARWVADERRDLGDRHRRGFLAAGADEVTIITGPPDDQSFGARLRDLVAHRSSGGLVVLGSGSIPLATNDDRRAFVAAAAATDRQALANNRYSADIVAISRIETLPAIPDLGDDNGLPRWLEDAASGYAVTDLRRRWRLAIDIDGPIDLVVIGAAGRHASAKATASVAIDLGPVLAAIADIRAVATDSRAELVVTGRTSATTLAWLERSTASRTRAIVEERGLRTRAAGQRPPASVIGALLDRDGPGSLGNHLARLGDAAIVDTRVLMAHRAGADERAWPRTEDRFASDLLLADRIADPWLRELTASVVAAPIPILLGGHTMVGPAVRLLLGRPRSARWR